MRGGGGRRVFSTGGPRGRADERKGGGWGERGREGGVSPEHGSKDEQGSVGSLNSTGGADGARVTVGSVQWNYTHGRSEGEGGVAAGRKRGAGKGKGKEEPV